MVLLRPGEKPTILQKILDLYSAIQSVAGIFALVFLVVRAAVKYGPRLFAFTSRLIGIYGAQSAVGLGVVLLGVAAHKFRQKRQKWYGMVEVAFGAFAGLSICLTLSPGQTLLSQWAALVGCVYVISRGLNNVVEAKKMARPLGEGVLPVNS